MYNNKLIRLLIILMFIAFLKTNIIYNDCYISSFVFFNGLVNFLAGRNAPFCQARFCDLTLSGRGANFYSYYNNIERRNLIMEFQCLKNKLIHLLYTILIFKPSIRKYTL